MQWCDEYALTCPGCREIYAERDPPGDPPCETCQVELFEENQNAAAVYMACRGQVITRGMDGVIVDINHLAVDAAIDRNGVKDRRRVFDQVVKTFHHFLKERSEAGD